MIYESHYNCASELYHHGVKGMKWGVRRAKKRAEKADRAIRNREATRKQNKIAYDEMNAQSRDKFSSPKKAKMLASALARNKAVYEDSEILNKYEIARQKAKKDKSYKNSSEYMQAKAAYGKWSSDTFIYGPEGRTRIRQLMNQGKTEKQAKHRTLAESAIGMIGGVAITALAGYALSKAQ
jgi:hypothetical protein